MSEPTEKKNKRRRRKPRKKPAGPIKPSFASLFKSDDKIDPNEFKTSADDKFDVGPIITHTVRPKRRLCVNYIPPAGRRASYDTWVFSYFSHLVQMRDIFVGRMNHSDAYVSKDWLYSFEFLEDFCQFMYEYSSGYVSPDPEEMNEGLCDYYHQFLIKRNELNE